MTAEQEKIAHADVQLLRYRLEKPVGGSGVSAVDVIVVNLETAAGAKGWGFSYALGGGGELVLSAARSLVERFVTGKPLLHPEAMHRTIRGALNRIGRGVHYLALAAIDVALWDLWSVKAGLPIGLAMGGSQRATPVYGSGGFNTAQPPGAAAEVALAHVASGFSAVKPRLAGVPKDLSVLRAVTDAVGDRAGIMIDTNEKCSVEAALRLKAAAREYGVLFFEEPIAALDYAGYETLAGASGVALATGEHLQGLVEAAPFLRDGLCAVIQPDLAMMGGLTECLRVARLAEALGVSVAPHFLPNLFVHLAAATPAVTWLEDFPLLEPLFEGLGASSEMGMLAIDPARPGLGFSLSQEAVKAYAV